MLNVRVFIAGIIGLMLSISPALAPDIELINKTDLSFLTPNQRQYLLLQIVISSHFEARLEHCGFKPDYERRATAAISACITPEAIANLRKLYRSKKELSVKIIAENQNKTGPERIDCSSTHEKKWLARVSKDLEDELRTLNRMCRAWPK